VIPGTKTLSYQHFQPPGHLETPNSCGTQARGEANAESDIDFLVEFEPTSSLLDLIHLEEALGDLLGVEVDVVSAGALLDRDDEIRRDALPLCGVPRGFRTVGD
jgi:predicted nucleotidyltransferase